MSERKGLAKHQAHEGGTPSERLLLLASILRFAPFNTMLRLENGDSDDVIYLWLNRVIDSLLGGCLDLVNINYLPKMVLFLPNVNRQLVYTSYWADNKTRIILNLSYFPEFWRAKDTAAVIRNNKSQGSCENILLWSGFIRKHYSIVYSNINEYPQEILLRQKKRFYTFPSS